MRKYFMEMGIYTELMNSRKGRKKFRSEKIESAGGSSGIRRLKAPTQRRATGESIEREDATPKPAPHFNISKIRST
jgi:hypothetical protein